MNGPSESPAYGDDRFLRLVIADDELLVRSGIKLILQSQADMEVVGEAGDGGEAVRLTRELEPSVVLMDVRMPRMGGLEATRRIVQSGVQGVRVLMLTTFDQDQYLYEAMKAGASGYLLKSTPPEQLVNSVRVVARGDTLVAPSITRRLIEAFVRYPPPAASHRPPHADLTDREVEVLSAIADGLSNAEIAQRLFLSEGTVKSHVNHILSKLGLRDRVQAVIFAYESGLVRPGDRDDRPSR